MNVVSQVHVPALPITNAHETTQHKRALEVRNRNTSQTIIG